jgi:hypothetical protein
MYKKAFDIFKQNAMPHKEKKVCFVLWALDSRLRQNKNKISPVTHL